MRPVNSLKAVLFVVLVLNVLVIASPRPFQEVRAASPSRVYFDRPTVCCTAAGPSNSATFSVWMDLASGERINGYDVRIDYSNFGSVLDAQSMDPTGNIFAGQSATVLAYCADGTSLLPQGNGCQRDDSPSGGQVHYSQLLIGTTLGTMTPVSHRLLFSITFLVNGTGSSLLTMDRANLLNPGPDQFPNPHYVQVTTGAAVFGNTGVVPFFDYEPLPPPSVLPGQFVPFDASLGFNGSSGVLLTDPGFGLTNGDYSWNFGDGSQLDTTSGPSASHSFLAAGNYTVRLSVTIPGGSVWSFDRRVFVYPFLGGLQITVKDQNGSPFRNGVRVYLYNSSQFTIAFENKTINAVGVVTFTGLSPSTYLVKFSGSSLASDGSSELLVNAGWTSQETVYLAGKVVSALSIDTATVVYLAVIVAGIGVVAAVLVLQRRSRAARKKLRGK